MNRLLVSLLAAFDAVIVVAVGLAIVLAPMTLLWVFGVGTEADWAALWPAGATVWQLGHFVPVAVTLPEELVVLSGLPTDAAAFTVSLAPLALAVFTAVFAYRSGARAARAGAWATGVGTGGLVVAALAAAVALTTATPITTVHTGWAIVFPALTYVVPALVGAVVRAWDEGDDGIVDMVSERIPDDVQDGIDAGARGLAMSLVGVVGLGALVLAVLFVVRGGEVVALTQAAHADLLGVVMLSLGALVYLPTLVVWFAAFAAGPGFAVGAGTAVSPAGTNLGVLPGIPVLGVVPESTSTWTLLLALLVVGFGAFAGWTARSALAHDGTHDPLRPRLVALGVMVVGSALTAVVLAWAAQGSLGPGRLADVGPEPGVFALAVGIEVGIGAAVLLLSPRGMDAASSEVTTAPVDTAAPVATAVPTDTDEQSTDVLDDLVLPDDSTSSSHPTSPDEQSTDVLDDLFGPNGRPSPPR
ncbi:cell division protein PerM [Microbacterium dauci]|uniref:DUF6350 family protein n=1 Tax=Microbacterium dauci TaxID=3048008 RepID=A0ABT6ZH99_9MICO|nr:DUF6350 family protein [Microbacterium sp. LX3-4]MDJ1115539.1 DUF6350 family protein [Microbacterium sp. LX3-4]